MDLTDARKLATVMESPGKRKERVKRLNEAFPQFRWMLTYDRVAAMVRVEVVEVVEVVEAE